MGSTDEKYNVALSAIKPRLRTGISHLEYLGVGVLAGHTIVVGGDGSMEEVPLDIMSSPVNLEKMWKACRNPVAILFREMMDDWYAVIPRDESLLKWVIRPIPGRDHCLYRARALAERAIQGDFHLESAIVSESNN